MGGIELLNYLQRRTCCQTTQFIGSVRIGYRADLTKVDPRGKRTAEPDKFWVPNLGLHRSFEVHEIHQSTGGTCPHSAGGERERYLYGEFQTFVDIKLCPFDRSSLVISNLIWSQQKWEWDEYRFSGWGLASKHRKLRYFHILRRDLQQRILEKSTRVAKPIEIIGSKLAVWENHDGMLRWCRDARHYYLEKLSELKMVDSINFHLFFFF